MTPREGAPLGDVMEKQPARLQREYAEYQYGAEDLDGHHSLFSRHAKDRSPEEWGVVVRQ
jgi:hypothetical protein